MRDVINWQFTSLRNFYNYTVLEWLICIIKLCGVNNIYISLIYTIMYSIICSDIIFVLLVMLEKYGILIYNFS